MQCLREQVLSRGKSPDLRDQNKRTPVHLAASEGQMAALRFLVEEARCEVNPIDGRQHTPLDDATREHRTEAAAYLLTPSLTLTLTLTIALTLILSLPLTLPRPPRTCARWAASRSAPSPSRATAASRASSQRLGVRVRG